MIFLRLIFVLIGFMFFRILFQKEKKIRFKQIIRNNQGKKYYRIDYL